MEAGPIVLVDDDVDDKTIFEEAMISLGIQNSLVWFDNTHEAYQYLKETKDQPFVIISDVNMPTQSGIEFKRQIDLDPQLRDKAIPFIFYSTAVNKETVTRAYKELTVQGFFQKKTDYHEILENIKLILGYWGSCKHPNSPLD